MLACPRCGDEEPEGSRFCGSCGAPFVPADPQPADTASMEAATPPRFMAPANTDAPPEVAPPPVRPQAEPPSPAPPPPAAAEPPARLRRRVSPFALIAALVLLIAAGTAAVLFASGVIGGNAGKSGRAFVLQVTTNVLSPLGRADETAAEHASSTDGAFAADGGRIVRVADEASQYLRSLSGLSRQQEDQVQLLLAFVAANRRYGQAFAAFAPADNQGQTALDRAAAEARAAIATAESGLPADLQLPSPTAFISLRSTLPPPESTTSATPPASDLASVYVRQVDDLLRRSHAVVLALNSFVPRAARDAISRSDAVALARSFTEKRRLELAQARALTVPPAFASAQRLLIRSLQASVLDDQALVAWTAARRDGSGNVQAAFDRANRIGAQATALKQQFLRVYGQQRQAGTGRSPASLPDIF
jgi:hypothetical protein